MKVKFTEDNELRKLPTRATVGAAAYDLYVPKDTVVKKGRNIIPLGFCVELDPHTAAEIHPRSGYASKGMEGYEIISKLPEKVSGDFIVTFDAMSKLMNPVEEKQYAAIEATRMDADVIYGLVDEDYRNEVGVIVNNHTDEFLIKKGTRVAQMLIVPVVDVQMEIVDELSPSDRKGGFGSTN